jgi:hypothetical protein
MREEFIRLLVQLDMVKLDYTVLLLAYELDIRENGEIFGAGRRRVTKVAVVLQRYFNAGLALFRLR